MCHFYSSFFQTLDGNWCLLLDKGFVQKWLGYSCPESNDTSLSISDFKPSHDGQFAGTHHADSKFSGISGNVMRQFHEIVQVSCAWGYTTTGGAKGVGESTTSAVVISLVLIFVFDFGLSFLFFQGQGDALASLA